MTAQICVFAGDGAAPEAMDQTVSLLSDLGLPLDIVQPSTREHVDALDQRILPDALREAIDAADTVLFGATSGRHGSVFQYLRREYGGGTYANVRPVTYFPGANAPLSNPEGIDYVVIRENLQGLYIKVDGAVTPLRDALAETDIDAEDRLQAADPGRFDVRAHGVAAIERFAEFAASIAVDRAGEDDPARLTCATKSNVLPQTDGLFDELVSEAAAERGVAYEHLHADDAAQQLVTNPHDFDVVVCPNIFGDVLSDLGAGTVGGLGLAPSGCYGDGVAYFEPVHGTAPDIAGEGVINPTATLLSAAMMLDYLEFRDAASDLRDAVVSVYAVGRPLTPDQGGSASTTDFVEAVGERL